MWIFFKSFVPVTLMFVNSVATYDDPSIIKFLAPPHSTTYSSTNKIVGGTYASILEHPYQVSFVRNEQFFCGGFIVSENYIVTAAHCLRNTNASSVVLQAGSSFTTNGTIIPIAELWSHPQYDDPPFDKDVGVMKTAEPIEFNNSTQPVKLPPKGRPLVANSIVTVSGWGSTSYLAGTDPEQLMHVSIPVVDHDTCFNVYPSTLNENQWCGGNFIVGGEGACYGDSGGPAVQEGMVVGIVSYSRFCAFPLSPTVFADTAAPAIRDFITEHTGL